MFSINTSQGIRLKFGNNYSSFYAGGLLSVYSGYEGTSLGSIKLGEVIANRAIVGGSSVDNQNIALRADAGDLVASRGDNDLIESPFRSGASHTGVRFGGYGTGQSLNIQYGVRLGRSCGVWWTNNGIIDDGEIGLKRVSSGILGVYDGNDDFGILKVGRIDSPHLYITHNGSNSARFAWSGSVFRNKISISLSGLIEDTQIQRVQAGTIGIYNYDGTTLGGLEVGSIVCSNSLKVTNLPTSDPGEPGVIWNDAGVLKVST